MNEKYGDLLRMVSKESRDDIFNRFIEYIKEPIKNDLFKRAKSGFSYAHIDIDELITDFVVTHKSLNVNNNLFYDYPIEVVNMIIKWGEQENIKITHIIKPSCKESNCFKMKFSWK